MNFTKLFKQHKSADEMAGMWSIRLSEPDCSENNRVAFEEWRTADPAHAKAYARIERSLSFSDKHASHPLFADLMDEVLQETTPTPSLWERFVTGENINRWAVASVGVACVAMFALSGTINFMQNPDDMLSYDTVVGERSTIALSDGSTMTLNTNSRVEVRFTEDQRKVSLVQGQAMFEVAKNKDRPFVVYADDQRVTALGTAFDVRLDEELDTVSIILVEGRIAVDELNAPIGANAPEPIPSKRVELVAGERLVASDIMPRVVELVQLKDVTSWQNGKVIFRDEPLGNAVREINRYSTTKLRLADDPRLQDIRVSGVFNAGQIKSFVYVLESTHGIEAMRTARKETTLVWPEKQFLQDIGNF